MLFLCAWHGVCRQETGLWERELWKLETGWGMCVYLEAEENDQGVQELTLLSGWAPALSHAPPLSSTSGELSCLLSHWCPSKLTPHTLPTAAALTHPWECELL